MRDGALLRVGRVADQLVAAELADHGIAGASWAKPDGVVQAGKLRLFPGAAPAGIVIAGCDPALGVAEALLHGLGPCSLLAISAPTGTAVRALKRGHLHAAVVHGISTELPKPPVPVIRWHLARWQVGLATAHTVPGDSLEAVLHGDAPIAQRDAAAASQQAFERASAKAGITQPRSGPCATGHIDAARIAATINGAAVTTEAAARAFDLRFFALEDHTVEIWLAERWLNHAGADALAGLLASTAFTQRVSHSEAMTSPAAGLASKPRPPLIGTKHLAARCLFNRNLLVVRTRLAPQPAYGPATRGIRVGDASHGVAACKLDADERRRTRPLRDCPS